MRSSLRSKSENPRRIPPVRQPSFLHGVRGRCKLNEPFKKPTFTSGENGPPVYGFERTAVMSADVLTIITVFAFNSTTGQYVNNIVRTYIQTLQKRIIVSRYYVEPRFVLYIVILLARERSRRGDLSAGCCGPAAATILRRVSCLARVRELYTHCEQYKALQISRTD